MSIIGLDDKGQISAELLLLLVVVLVIIGSITIPLIGKSIDASNNVSYVSDTSNAVNSIADAVNIVYANGPGAKRTLNVYIPQGTTLVFDNTNHTIGVNVTGLNYTDSNGAQLNSRYISSSIDYTGNIALPPKFTKGQFYTIQVYWSPSATIIINSSQ